MSSKTLRKTRTWHQHLQYQNKWVTQDSNEPLKSTTTSDGELYRTRQRHLPGHRWIDRTVLYHLPGQQDIVGTWQRFLPGSEEIQSRQDRTATSMHQNKEGLTGQFSDIHRNSEELSRTGQRHICTRTARNIQTAEWRKQKNLLLTVSGTSKKRALGEHASAGHVITVKCT